MKHKIVAPEGVILGCVILILILWAIGGLTGTGVIGFTALTLAVILVDIVLIIICICIYTLVLCIVLQKQGDFRPFARMYRQEFNRNKIVEGYRLCFGLIAETLRESEMLAAAARRMAFAERRLLFCARHPMRALQRDWDITDADLYDAGLYDDIDEEDADAHESSGP